MMFTPPRTARPQPIRGSVAHLYGTLMRTSVQVQFQYRVSNYLYMLGMIAEPVVYLVVWQTIARSQGGEVGGYTAGTFSFNTTGGRCDACDGLECESDASDAVACWSSPALELPFQEERRSGEPVREALGEAQRRSPESSGTVRTDPARRMRWRASARSTP